MGSKPKSPPPPAPVPQAPTTASAAQGSSQLLDDLMRKRNGRASSFLSAAPAMPATTGAGSSFLGA